MRKKIYKNIRLIVIVLLLLIFSIIIGVKYLYKNNHRFNDAASLLETSKDEDITLIELITDTDDDRSIEFGKHLKKVCDYSKFPIMEVNIDNWNSTSHKIKATTKVIVVQNTLELNDESLDKLLNFVSRGGLLFVPNYIDDERMAYFYGLTKGGNRDVVNKPVGYYFHTNFLPNVKNTEYADFICHSGLNRASFKDNVSIIASAKNDREYPTIIENKVGLGSVILFNTYDLIRKQDRGLLHAAILKGLEGIPYPIANVNTIFLDDFPSPLYDIKEDPIKEEMDLTIVDFVKDVWWPDMLKLADTFNIKYTALTVFDYRNLTKPPFLFDQWNTNTIVEDDKKYFVSDWMAKDVLKHGHELGLQGYNHVSLQIDDWKEPDFMKIALNSAKKKWSISNMGRLPVSYVPPSNYIDSIGMSQLALAFPSMKYMSSLYLGDFYDGGDREFDVEKWNPKFFNYPRISSGYDLDNEDKFVQQSLYIYTGIWTHFVHPDDVYQIPSNDNRTTGHFSLRNKNNLGWHKTKGDKPGMLGVFGDYLHKLERIYPFARYLSAEEGAVITRNWRESNYIFSKDGQEYFVEKTDNNEKGEYYWFLYASITNAENIELELNKKGIEYRKTPMLNGSLYSIKTKKPSLSIKNRNLNGLLVNTIASRVSDDYNLYNDIPQEFQLTDIAEYYTKPSKNAPLKERVDYYVSSENLVDAANLLKQKISSKKVIDTGLFNAYYKYMERQDKPDEAWTVLQSHINNYPISENIKYSRLLGTKYGYPNETIRKAFLKQQINEFNDNVILKDYYNTFNSAENNKEIEKILKSILVNEPSLKNELNYLKHLIAYDEKKAIVELNKYVPDETSSLWNISEEISWLYANNKRYKKAYDWSKHTKKIAITNKLYWLSEIKDYDTLRKEYIHYIANNPNDVKTKAEISKILLANGKQVESWGLVSALPSNDKHRDTLKRALNNQVIYLKTVTQKDLINRYSDLFEADIKKQIEKKIRLSENNSIEAEVQIIGDNRSHTSFEKKFTYHLKTKKMNTHSISVTNSDLYDINQSSFSDQDNINKSVYGLAYKYNNKPSEKINYWAMGSVEKDKEDNLFYQAEVGVSFPKEKSFTSVSANTFPVKTGPGYQKKIYQSQLAVYQESNIKNVFKSLVYLEGNHYSNNDMEGSITTKLVLDNNKKKMFKVLPQLEASYSKSNSDGVKNYPYFLVEKRFFAGGGIGLKYGMEDSKFNIRVEGSTFIDNDFGDFNRFTSQASIKIGNFTKLTVSAKLSTQTQAYSNSLQIGLKHTF